MYTIEKNITLRANIEIPSGTDWVTIPAGFNGTFQGNGCIIQNLKINVDEDVEKAVEFGLFRSIQSSGKIYNLELSNVTITSSGSRSGTVSVGALAGLCRGTISGCKLKSKTDMKVDKNGGALGGFVGILCGSGKIVNCTTTKDCGTIKGYANVGGIAGVVSESATIDNCTNYANVYYCYNSINGTAGGISGKMLYSSTVKNCTNYGLIKYDGLWDLSGKRPCMAQIVGWQVDGSLVDNRPLGTTNYKNLNSKQMQYCTDTVIGRYGE